MNSDAPPLEELISRHFDDATSAGESAALAQQLANDPAAALQFVRTARLHAMLEAASPPRTGRRAVLLRRWLGFGAAAALVAAAGGAAIFLFSKPLRSGTRPQVVLESEEHRADRKPLPPSVKLRTVKNFARATTVPRVSLDYLLANFYVHADPNGLRVPEALRALEQAIGDANLLNRPELGALKFAAGPSMIPSFAFLPDEESVPKLRFDQGLSDFEANPVIVSALPTPLTIQEYLNICGLFREVTQQPGETRYAAAPTIIDPLEATTRKARLSTRTFRMNPALYGRWHGENFKQDNLRLTLRNLFGVTLGKREMLDVSNDRASLTVTSSEPKLDRIDQVLNVYHLRQTTQHYLTTKYVLCPPDLLPSGFDTATGMLLSEAEYQRFTGRLALETGIDLVTAPSVIVRAGQAAAIEILFDKPGSQPAAPRQTDWFGLRQEILTTCVGETIQVSGLVDLGLPATSGMVPFSEIIGNDDAFRSYGAEDVKHHMTGYDIWVPNGYTAVFTLDVDTDGRGVALACVTAQVIDSAGQ